MTVEGVCARAQCGKRLVYRAVQHKRLRAARINERGDLRFLPEWVDAWLASMATTPDKAA